MEAHTARIALRVGGRNLAFRPLFTLLKKTIRKTTPPYHRDHYIGTAEDRFAPASRNVPSIDQGAILSPSCLPHSRSIPRSERPRPVPSLGQQGHRKSDQQVNRSMRVACHR